MLYLQIETQRQPSMKNGLIVCIVAFSLLLAAACTRSAKPSDKATAPLHDTLYTEKAALDVYGKNPHRALLIIDSALLVGNIDEDRATFLKAKVFSLSTFEKNLDTARQMLEGLMVSDFVDVPQNRQDVLDLLVTVARIRSDNVSLIRWATEKSSFCRQHDLDTEASRTEAEIAVALYIMGDVEKSLSRLNGIIASLDNRRHFNEMDACIIALKRKITLLEDLERWDEIIPLANRINQKIKDFSENTDDYADGSVRMPPDKNKLHGYCDFYTTEAYAYIATAYAELGKLDSARHYLKLFKNGDYSRASSVNLMVASVYRCLGDYNTLLSVYEDVVADMGNDTLNSTYASMLYSHVLAAEARGNIGLANHYLHRYNTFNQQLTKNQLASRAFEYATRFHLKEEKLKAEKEQHRAEINKRISITLALFILIVIALCVWLLVQHRTIKRKNHALLEEISEAVKYKDLVDKIGAVVRSDTSSDKLPDLRIGHNNTMAERLSNDKAKIDNMTDEELFIFLNEIICDEKLFTDPNFGRQTLMSRFHISERRIGAAFSRGNKANSVGSDAGSAEKKSTSSLPEFIRERRLEYACRLLVDYPDLNIRDISDASGFGSPIVFNRAFKGKYNVTPTEYRSQLHKS